MNEQATKGHPVSKATKEKISKKMKGKSNFKGKSHKPETKQQIADERGHDDRVEGRKWRTDKATGEQSRVYQKGSAKRFRWGRRLSEWLEQYLEQQ